MKRFLRLLLSRRVAVLALVVLTGLLLLSALAPERLEAGRLVQSPLFLLLPAFLALSILASSWERLRVHLRGRKREGPPPLERHAVHWSEDLPLSQEEAIRRVGRGLRAAGVTLRAPGAQARSGSRGAGGFWGSMIFHAGLLVTLGGMCASALGRFRGQVVLAEGVPVEISPSALQNPAPPQAACGLEGTRLAVSDVSASYADLQRLTDVAGVLAITPRGKGAVRREFVGVNVPVWIGDCQLTVERYGFAPDLQAWDAAGRSQADGMATVRVQPPGAEDPHRLEGGGILQLRLFPDYLDRGGTPGSRSRLPLRPVLGFRWIEGDREVATGLVPHGETVVVNGYRVAFRGLHYWVGLSLGKDPGLGWFTVGGLTCIAGLCARFAWPAQAWRVRVEQGPAGSHVDLSLSARYDPAMLRERLERLKREVRVERESS